MYNAKREFRYLELEIGGKVVTTNKFDFGCCCIFQNKCKEYEDILKKDKSKYAEFLESTVLDILCYRLLDGKLSIFPEKELIDPKTVVMLFDIFSRWYKEDNDYMSYLMEDFNGQDSKDDSCNTYDYLAYVIFKSHSIPQNVVKSWSMQEVAELMYFSAYDKAREDNKNNVKSFGGM